MMKYLYNLGLSLDQLLNAILLGDPDESVSGRCGRAMKSGKPKFWVPGLTAFIDAMAFIVAREMNHCSNAIEPEEMHQRELWSWIKE